MKDSFVLIGQGYFLCTFILHKGYDIMYNKHNGEECPKEGLDNE